MKKILIDARMIGLEHAGIGRYVLNLVKELNKNKKFNTVLLVTPKGRKQLTIRPSSPLVIIEANAKHYTFREQLLIPWLLLKIKPDLIHFPHFNVPLFCFYPFVVTIHDLIKHSSRGKETTTRSQPLYWLKYLLYRFIFWWTIRRAKKIITPSQTVKEELVKGYGINPDRVVPIYQGVEEKFKVKSEKLKVAVKSSKLLEQYKITKPFLIYTGSLYPHKNIDRLIQSIKLVNQKAISYKLQAISLVIVCSRNVFWQRVRKKIKKMKAEKFVKLIGFVPDDDLIQLYQEAIAFIQPSLMEGFDLPVLEALAAGLPCLISDIPVHREIYQDAPLYFNPQDSKNIAKTINLALKQSHSPDYETMVRKGQNLAKKFSWQKTAKQTLKVYQKILEV